MYLSDRDLQWAIDRELLIVRAPEGVPPPKVDPSSIDLRLDRITEAKVWDIDAYKAHVGVSGDDEPVLHVGSLRYRYGEITRFLVPPPEFEPGDSSQKVYHKGDEIYIRQGGFLLWQTKETIGTPKQDPRFICFIDGKSTRARAGLIVHLTAPTIHAGWSGNVTLEISNLGPFTFGLRENDVIAQLTVAMISSPPAKTHQEAGSSTLGQTHVGGLG
jgi:deoxycytidine triphosphate deaminase